MHMGDRIRGFCSQNITTFMRRLCGRYQCVPCQISETLSRCECSTRYVSTFDELHNPKHEHQLMSVVDPNTLERPLEERATREPARPTDIASFLYEGDRDVLAEYSSAIRSVGPFSAAFMSVRKKDTEDKFESKLFYGVASYRYPHAPRLYLEDYTHSRFWSALVFASYFGPRASQRCNRFDQYCHESDELTADCDSYTITSDLLTRTHQQASFDHRHSETSRYVLVKAKSLPSFGQDTLHSDLESRPLEPTAQAALDPYGPEIQATEAAVTCLSQTDWSERCTCGDDQ